MPETLCIASVSWRRPHLVKMLDTLAHMPRAPKDLILMLDGPQTEELPIIPNAFNARIHAYDEKKGCPQRWRLIEALIPTVDEDHVTFVLDDDINLNDGQYFSILRNTLEDTQASAICWDTKGFVSTTGEPRITSRLAAGVCCIRTHKLAGLFEHPWAHRFMAASGGSDELHVGGFLWEQAAKKLCIYRVSRESDYHDFETKYAQDARAIQAKSLKYKGKLLNLWMQRGLPMVQNRLNRRRLPKDTLSQR